MGAAQINDYLIGVNKMEIIQHWKKTPEVQNKNNIPDKFGHWFAQNLPDFFTVGVTQRQIANAMPPKLFVEWCRINNIRYWDFKYTDDLVGHDGRKEGKDEKQ